MTEVKKQITTPSSPLNIEFGAVDVKNLKKLPMTRDLSR